MSAKQIIFQSVSNLFHPLLSMLWATVLFVQYTPLVVQTTSVKLFLIGTVAFYSAILPSIIIMLMVGVGIVKNGVALRDRKDRIFPLGVQIITYAIQWYSLDYMGMPLWALQFYKGAFLLAALCFVVSFWWKISAHAAGNASIATAAIVLLWRFPTLMPIFVPVLMIVVTGFVSSIRIYLGRHTLAQVYAGSLAGITCMLLGAHFY
ncbi:MAG: hypothetical protein KBT20_03490 [Bacteroidales bacterium]|nr:hypothetical protein [Candidatus Liminaster caballi]